MTLTQHAHAPTTVMWQNLPSTSLHVGDISNPAPANTQTHKLPMHLPKASLHHDALISVPGQCASSQDGQAAPATGHDRQPRSGLQAAVQVPADTQQAHSLSCCACFPTHEGISLFFIMSNERCGDKQRRKEKKEQATAPFV